MGENVFDTPFTTLDQLLTNGEGLGPIEDLEDFRARRRMLTRVEDTIFQVREMLASSRREHLLDVEQRLRSYQERYRLLSKLPRQEDMAWAQNLLQFPNLLLLAVDEDDGGGFFEDVAIIRLLAIDTSAMIHFDSCFEPELPLDEEITFWTGVTLQDIEQAPSLVEAWASLLDSLSGKYIVAYDFKKLQEKLTVIAKVFKLEPPVIFGTSLELRARQYFHYPTHNLPFEKLCLWTACLLPPHPQQTALDRARAILHILQAMAQGIVTIEAKQETPDRWRRAGDDEWMDEDEEEEEEEEDDDEWVDEEEEEEEDEEEWGDPEDEDWIDKGE